MTLRESREAGFFFCGGADRTVLYPHYQDGYAKHIHTLKFTEMYTKS